MIKITNIDFGYTRKKQLFTGMSLELPEGRIAGLLGRNGEGKSTLLKLIAGQLLRKSGDISILGDDPGKRRVALLQQIFMVPEVVNPPKMKIKTYFSLIAPFYPTFDAELAEKLLKIFDINENMSLNSISQGQQKKAILALAISLRTKILLMDEPTNGLDIPSKSAFRRIIAENVSPEQTIIISTHQVRDLDQLIDHIIVLNDNQIILSKDIEELSADFDFIPVKDAPERTPIYTEHSPIGAIGVYAAQGKGETEFSIELFFNALISQKETIKQYISR